MPQTTIPACNTVGQLVQELKKLNPSTPVAANGIGMGLKPVLFNKGLPDEHLAFEENDGTWD